MESILAQFVTWNNVINDYAVNVQNLLAPALGAMVAEVVVGRNVDTVHLDLVTPFNKQRAAPQHHILIDWIKNQELREADAALAQARLSLMQFLEQQADVAYAASRTLASRGSNTIVPGVPRVVRHDTPGAPTLAVLTEAPSGSPPPLTGTLSLGSERTGSGRPFGFATGAAAAAAAESVTAGNAGTAGAVAEGTTTEAAARAPPAAQSLSGSQQPLPLRRPPGSAESCSTDASDTADTPQTLPQHLAYFNACIACLQQHLGPNFGVYFHVTPAACPAKGKCTHVRLMRHPNPSKLAAAVTSGTAATAAELKAAARASARPHRPGASVTFAAAPSRAASHHQPHATSNGRGILTTSTSRATSLGGHGPDPPAPGSAAAILGEEAIPATLVDIVYGGVTDAILKAERSVAVVGNELARLFGKYEPPLSLIEEPKACRKLKTLPVAKEYVEANRRIQQLNAVLFKLAKACAKTAWIYSTPLSMPDGAMGDVAQMVCEALRRVADTTWAMCKRQLDSVHLVTLLTHYEPFTITPKLTNEEQTFRFELDVVVDQALLIERTFPDFLPAQMRAVWDALLALAAVVQESRVTLVPLRQQYNRLADEAREFYTMAPEASKARALSVTEAMRVARVVNRNLKSMYESEAVFEAYNKNVQRVVDAYTRAVKEVKADLQAKLAELATKLPRSIVKPSFSPEMLQLARSTVNPTELAATMTLALTASNMDPAAVAMMQQSLALGALGAPGMNGAANGAAAAAAAAGAGVVQAAGHGATAALSNLASYQQQQQMLLMQQQMAMQQMQQAAMQQQQQQMAAGAYGGVYDAAAYAAAAQQQAAAQMQLMQQQQHPSASDGTPQPTQQQNAGGGAAQQPAGAGALAAANAAAHVPASAHAPAVPAPSLGMHGTSADYQQQLAMAQAYGYAAFPGAMYGGGMHGTGAAGPNGSMAGPLGQWGHNGGAAGGGIPPAGPGGTRVAQEAAAAGGSMVGTYQSAGYDANTMTMLAQMGYGGFSVGEAQQGAGVSVGQGRPAAGASSKALASTAGAGGR